MIRAALRFARRELRTGTRGFRIFLACLALGVAAIAGVQTVARGLHRGLAEDGRAILGGDLALRQTFRPVEAATLAVLADAGAVSTIAELRAMARGAASGRTRLVELKAVDDAYPLVGTVSLADGATLASALQRRGGTWGAAVEPAVLEKLGVALGDRVRIGELEVEVRATLSREPDRIGTGGISFGPRVLVALPALAATGLVREGSLIAWHHRLRLAPGRSAADLRQRLEQAFPDPAWQVREVQDAAPQLAQFIDRLALFLTLVGLAALLVGGVGIADAVRGFVGSRLGTIAVLRCLGGPARLVVATYAVQIGVLAVVGVGLGLVAGAAVPFLIEHLARHLLPVGFRATVDPAALAPAVAFGLLVALAFTLWPLGQVHRVSPSALFRSRIAPLTAAVPLGYRVASVVAGAVLAGIAVATAQPPQFAAWFMAGAAGAFIVLRGAGAAIVLAAAALPRPSDPRLRMALANLHRPGNPTGATVLSLGLSLTVLVALALVQASFSRQIGEHMPAEAPAFFFVDIQPDQIDAFRATVGAVPGTGEVAAVPALRGRIVRVNGRPADAALVNPDQAWILRGDRGVTYSATVPAGSRILAGDWWPADYAGPPLLSIYRSVAEAFGIGVGDELGVNILGRTFKARVASIREMNFLSLTLNFTLVFSPGVLEAAPGTFIATVRAPPETEAALEAATVAAFPNVTAVRVRETLGTVQGVLADIGTAVRGIAGIAIAAGVLVLAGALIANQRRRLYDDVVLKVLGATRRDLVICHLAEFVALGLVTALIAAAAGTVAAWAVVRHVLAWPWHFEPSVVLVIASATVAVISGLGLASMYWTMRQPAAGLLRNE